MFVKKRVKKARPGKKRLNYRQNAKKKVGGERYSSLFATTFLNLLSPL